MRVTRALALEIVSVDRFTIRSVYRTYRAGRCRLTPATVLNVLKYG